MSTEGRGDKLEAAGATGDEGKQGLGMRLTGAGEGTNKSSAHEHNDGKTESRDDMWISATTRVVRMHGDDVTDDVKELIGRMQCRDQPLSQRMDSLIQLPKPLGEEVLYHLPHSLKVDIFNLSSHDQYLAEREEERERLNEELVELEAEVLSDLVDQELADEMVHLFLLEMEASSLLRVQANKMDLVNLNNDLLEMDLVILNNDLLDQFLAEQVEERERLVGREAYVEAMKKEVEEIFQVLEPARQEFLREKEELNTKIEEHKEETERKANKRVEKELKKLAEVEAKLLVTELVGRMLCRDQPLSQRLDLLKQLPKQLAEEVLWNLPHSLKMDLVNLNNDLLDQYLAEQVEERERLAAREASVEAREREVEETLQLLDQKRKELLREKEELNTKIEEHKEETERKAKEELKIGLEQLAEVEATVLSEAEAVRAKMDRELEVTRERERAAREELDDVRGELENDRARLATLERLSNQAATDLAEAEAERVRLATILTEERKLADERATQAATDLAEAVAERNRLATILTEVNERATQAATDLAEAVAERNRLATILTEVRSALNLE